MNDERESPTIRIRDLRRVYSSRSLTGGRRETVALNGISLDIPKNSVFGLLGPNGAGKTTTVRILSTLLTPTRGSASVVGLDVVRQAKEVRKRIGLVLGGDRGLYGRLSGRHNLVYLGALNHMNPRVASRRVDELLDQVGLVEASERPIEEYSRGMKQRLHIARGLLPDPEILFLDEPTMGLDPAGAQELRALIPTFAASGKTVLLTTHYMSEADLLCNEVAIIDQGRVVAEGTPTEIKRSFSGIRVLDVTVNPGAAEDAARLSEIAGVEGVNAGPADGALANYMVYSEPSIDLTGTVSALFAGRVEALSLRGPTLEEAYLRIVGHKT